MLHPHFFITALLCLFLGAEATVLHAAVGTTQSTEPAIRVVSGRVVVVDAPAGFASVKLQVLTSPLKGRARRWQKPPAPEWKTVASRATSGEAAVLRFVIPTLTARRNLRVYGVKAAPLPEILVTGPVTFPPASPPAIPPVTPPVIPPVDPPVTPPITIDPNPGPITTELPNLRSQPLSAEGESAAWKIAGNRLYYFNYDRGLQAFDISNPDDPALIGTLPLPAAGREMHLLDPSHVILLRDQGFGNLGWSDPVISVPPPPAGALPPAGTITLQLAASLQASANVTVAAPFESTPITGVYRGHLFRSAPHEVVVADVSAGVPRQIAAVRYEGSLHQSRLIRKVLYVAATLYEASGNSAFGNMVRQITSFDLSDPAHPVLRDIKTFEGEAAIYATDRFFYIASRTLPQGSVVRVLDVSDPTGLMVRAGELTLPGQVRDKLWMHRQGDIFSAVSSTPVVDETTGVLQVRNTVSTFSLADPQRPAPLGSREFSPGQPLYVARFDGDRLYAAGGNGGPLRIFDLSDPAQPALAGEIALPRFTNCFEPLGDRLVTLSAPESRANVSLFDVSDAAHPALLSTVALGADLAWVGTNGTLSGFTVLPGLNTILLPFSGNPPAGGYASGVKIIDLLRNELRQRGAIDGVGGAVFHGPRAFAISLGNLRVVDVTNRDRPATTASVQVSWPVNIVHKDGGYLLQISRGYPLNGVGAEITVAPATNPDEALSELRLTGGSVVATTTRGGVLYLFHGSDSDRYGSPTPPRGMQLTAVDISRLPELKLLGQFHTPDVMQTYDGRVTPLWVNDRTLVFAVHGSKVRLGFVIVPVYPPATTSIHPTLGPNFDGYFGSGLTGRTQELFAFDVTSPAEPKLASRLTFGVDEAWDVAPPLAANDSIYLGFKVMPILAANWDAAAPLASSETPKLDLYFRDFMKLIDYSDSSAPTVSAGMINLPGEPVSLSRQGQLIYTMGVELNLATGVPLRDRWSPYPTLHVSGFDGAAAHLLDQLPLHSINTPCAFSGETVFVLHPEEERLDNPKKTSLETLTVKEETGKFTRLGLIEGSHEEAFTLLDSVAILRNYRNNREIRLLDARDPARLLHLGAFQLRANGRTTLDFSAADPTLGLWIPLAGDGVESVLLR